MFAFDFGVWGYLYPGGQCFGARRHRCCRQVAVSESHRVAAPPACRSTATSPRRAPASTKVYAKVNVTLNDQFAGRRQRVLLAELPEPRRLGQLRLDHRQVDRAESTIVRHQRRRHVHLRRVRPPVARHLGRVLRHDVAARLAARSRTAFHEPSYNTWNIGIGFTYKVFTLDLRYSDTNLSKGDCNAFTSDYTPPDFSHGSFITRSTRAASAPTGAARPASSSSRLT